MNPVEMVRGLDVAHAKPLENLKGECSAERTEKKKK